MYRGLANVCLLFLAVTSAVTPGITQPHRPNVCAEREVMMIGRRQPCVQAFTRMVKVWKQGCGEQKWCVGHERRTAYYTAYRHVYSMDFQMVYKCCPGWRRLNSEAGCLYRELPLNIISMYNVQLTMPCLEMS